MYTMKGKFFVRLICGIAGAIMAISAVAGGLSFEIISSYVDGFIEETITHDNSQDDQNNDGGTNDGDNGGGGGFELPTGGVARYNLYGTDTAGRGTIPFPVIWPQAPRITRSLTVTNGASLATALATPGARINVRAGNYGTLALRQDDQIWELADGAVFSGLTATGRPTRVIVQGGVINPGFNTPIALVVDDFVMANVNIPAVFNMGFGAGSNMSNRVAFIHNTVRARSAAFFTPGQSASDVGAFGSDMIIAANYLQGGVQPGNSGAEPALRVQSNIRTIIVDNRARTGLNGQRTKHTYRSHYGNQDYFMRRNMNEYGDGIYFQPRANQNTIRPSNRMGDHWVYDHLNYYNGPGIGNGPEWIVNSFRTDATTTHWPGRLIAVNNRAYRAIQTNPLGVLDGPGRWRWNAKAGDVLSNNIEFPYQAPPALGAWLAADGLPPGADH